MVLRIVLIALAQVALLVSSLSGTWAAQTVGLTADLYPAGSHIASFPAVSNADMDCNWGFFCEGGVPVFHLSPQDVLHRVGGWSQYAGYRHNGLVLRFAVYASTYASGTDAAGRAWSHAAFDDFVLADRINGYRMLPRETPAIQVSGQSGAMAALQRNGPIDLIVMAAWTGAAEVEGLALFPHRSPAMRRAAVRDLRRQVEMAERQICQL
jgi:hypothetical protein